jgi:HEPN domain-containing protein
MATVPERWAEQARYDLETAKSMLETGRMIYVLFCCQQAVEKMLKAIIAKRTGQLPPRLHNLIRLTEFISVDVEKVKADFLRELSTWYVQSRYPEEISDIAEQISYEKAYDIFKKTEEVIQWLSSMLQ